MYIIDDADKSYVAFDKATMEQLAKKITAAMAQMKEQLAKLPPEQRAQMEQMMPGMSDGEKKWAVEAVDTGKSDKVDGRACRVWDIKRNGELDDQLCVVPYSVAAGQGKFPGHVREFRQGVRGNGEIRPHVVRHDDQRIRRAGQGEWLPGSHARLRRRQARRLPSTVMSVWREEAIPASMFDIPAGYKQKQMPMGDK